MSRCFAFIAFCAFLITAGFSLDQQAMAQQIVKPAAPGISWAIDPESGVVASVDPQNDKANFYRDISTGEAVQAATAKTPTDIFFKVVGKKRYFVTASIDTPELCIFDATDFTQIKRVRVAIDRLSSVTGSINPEDPYVYYCGGNGHDSRVGRFDLANLLDVGVVRVGGGRESVMDCAISAGGDIIYCRGPWSPSGFYAAKLNPTKPVASTIHYDHTSVMAYVSDQAGEMVAAGPAIYSPDLKREIGRLPEPVIAFAPDSPSIMTVTRAGLSVYSANTFKKVNQVPLDGDLTDDGRDPNRARNLPRIDASRQADFKRVSYRPHVLFDQKRKRVIVSQADTIAILKYENVVVKEPYLLARLDAPLKAVPGVPLKAAFKIDPSVKVSLVGKIENMSLAGNTLAWTPSENDIGLKRIELKLSANDIERTQQVEIEVARPSIELPFIPTLVATSTDGKLALAVRSVPEHMQREGGENGTQLAMVNLQTMQVMSRRSFAQPVVFAKCSGSLVFVGSPQSNAFYALSTSDLSEVRRLFAPDAIAGLEVVDDKRLFVSANGGRGLVLKLPSLDADTLEPVFAGVANRSGGEVSNSLPAWNGSGWYWNGVVYDKSMSSITRLINAGSFFEVAGSMRDSAREMQRRERSAIEGIEMNSWGVSLNNGQIMRWSGQRVSQQNMRDPGNQSPLIILRSKPLGATLRMSYRNDGRSQGCDAVIELIDLGSGSPAASVPIYSGPALSQNSGGGQDRFMSLQSAGESRLVAQLWDRLFLVDLPEGKTYEPLRIGPMPKLAVLSADAPLMEIQLTSLGGTEPRRFSSPTELPGVKVDPSGKVQIEASKLRGEAVNRFVTGFTRSGVDPKVALSEYRRLTLGSFRTIAGREPAGVPMALSMTVTVEDRDLMTNEDRFVVLLDIPLADIQQAITAMVAAMPQPATRPAPIAQRAEPALEQRMLDLERKVDRLSAQIELLTSILRDQSPSTRPSR